jgi:hypothetical protein
MLLGGPAYTTNHFPKPARMLLAGGTFVNHRRSSNGLYKDADRNTLTLTTGEHNL